MPHHPDSCIVTGTHTDAGKTLCAAVLAAGLGATYWKPIQAGRDDAGRTDTDRVARLGVPTMPEAVFLQAAESPHSAAAKEGRDLSGLSLTLPKAEGPLVVEGAGGLLVPLAEDLLLAEVFQQLGLPVVLVADAYLGCINHTLLSVQALHAYKLPIRGLLFNRVPAEGPQREAVDFIARYTRLPVLGMLPDAGPEEGANLAALFRQHVHWQ